ncbi:hypothetical protein D3C80_2238810 [compost metagenome]
MIQIHLVACRSNNVIKQACLAARESEQHFIITRSLCSLNGCISCSLNLSVNVGS